MGAHYAAVLVLAPAEHLPGGQQVDMERDDGPGHQRTPFACRRLGRQRRDVHRRGRDAHAARGEREGGAADAADTQIPEGGDTLLKVLDNTATPMGARLLKRWLVFPLKDIQKINEAYERLLKCDVKYRFVIDMASLKR